MKRKLAAALAVLFLALSASCSAGSADTSSKSESTAASSSVQSSDESIAESTDESSSVSETTEEASSDESKKSVPESSEEEVSSPVDSSWFDDSIFIGDSIMTGLERYAANGCLGNADFLAKECMGYFTALKSVEDEYGIHPEYSGQLVMIDDTVKLIGKKNVFVMLGMNDICAMGGDDAAAVMTRFTDGLMEKNPDIKLYVMTVTPMVAGITRSDYLNNENIARFNTLAKQICKEKGYVFLDVAEALGDGSGNLRLEYCGDSQDAGFHFSDEGNRVWVEFLKEHALDKP